MPTVRLAALVVLSLALARCSSAPPSPPATLTPAPAPFPLHRWLTPDRQERLADAVSTLANKHGWAAGCVFRWNGDESVLEEFERPQGVAAFSFIADPALRPGVVVYVEGDTKAGGSYREVIPSTNTFCYVPE